MTYRKPPSRSGPASSAHPRLHQRFDRTSYLWIVFKIFRCLFLNLITSGQQRVVNWEADRGTFAVAWTSSLHSCSLTTWKFIFTAMFFRDEVVSSPALGRLSYCAMLWHIEARFLPTFAKLSALSRANFINSHSFFEQPDFSQELVM